MTLDLKEAIGMQISGKQRRILISLYWISVFLYWFSLYVYAPTLPLYVQSKTANLTIVGVVLAQYGLWQLISRFPFGFLADYLGRRKLIIIAGFLFGALGAWLLANANSTETLIVARAITGLSAAIWALLLVVFSNLFPPSETLRATALLTLANSTGRMLASSLNGPLNALGGYSLAFYMGSGAAVLAMLVILPAHETRAPSQSPSLNNLIRVFKRRDVLLPSLLDTLIQFGIWCSTFGFFPILIKKLGGNDIVQSLLIALNLGALVAGNLIITRLIKKVPSRWLILVSLGTMVGGIWTAAVAPNLTWMVVAQLLTGISMGFGYPLLMGMSIENVDETDRNTAMVLHQSIYAVGMIAGPWLGGLLGDALGVQPMFWVIGAITLVFGLICFRFLSPR
jgi:MFS transporter, DHA1 family, multidrug resistance protein